MNNISSSGLPYALVVDDNGLIRMEAVDILEQVGFTALEAQTGDQALSLLHEHHDAVRVLFTDVQMPGRHDGFALARKTADAYPHIAIVVVSGHARPGPGDLPIGARFIGKPFSVRIVSRHLMEMMSDWKTPQKH